MEGVFVHDFDTTPASADTLLELLCEAVYECLRYDQREIVRQRSSEMFRGYISYKNAREALIERQTAVRLESERA